MKNTIQTIVIMSCCLIFGSIDTAIGASIQEIETALNEKRWDEADTARKELLNGRKKKYELGKAITAVSEFLKEYDSCHNMQQPAKNDEIERYYKNLINHQWSKVPRKVPFSKPFVEELNGKRNFALQMIEEEKQRSRAKWEWEKAADDLLRLADESAIEKPEYIIVKSPCTICGLLEQKQKLEKAIENEKHYSSQYGVINLNKIEKYKQAIMQIDPMMAENKKEYKKNTGGVFTAAQCTKKLLETCADNLVNLQKEIARKIAADKLNLIYDQDKKNYMTQYIETKQSLQ